MTREEKDQVIVELTEILGQYPHVYVTDVATLTVEKTNKLRRECFGKGIKMLVAKNTLIRKAMERSDVDFTGLYDTLKGNTALMFSDVANAPAKVIQGFRKGTDKPAIKGALVSQEFYIGDKVAELASIKSKEEMVGEIIGLLQSPAQRVISALLENAKNKGGEEVAA